MTFDAQSIWLNGLKRQFIVVHALVIRDALRRYGHENLGFFWVIGEPLLFASGVILVWSLMNATHGGHVSVVPFALSGYSFITMFRHISSRSIGIVKSSSNLFFHQGIKAIDVAIAQSILEIIGCFSAFTIAYIPLYLLGYCPKVSDPLLLVSGFFLAGLFSFAFGLLLAGLSDMTESLHHITPAIMYLTLPLTGIFYMVDWLPPSAQKIVLWSPLVNSIEMFRSGIFDAETEFHYSISFLMFSIFVTMSVGLYVFNISVQKRSS